MMGMMGAQAKLKETVAATRNVRNVCIYIYIEAVFEDTINFREQKLRAKWSKFSPLAQSGAVLH